MLSTVDHEWSSCVWFEFNCYNNWDTLVIRVGDGTVHLLYSKEGVNQGDSLAMVAYELGILPLVR